jgi:hypothetical protein
MIIKINSEYDEETILSITPREFLNLSFDSLKSQHDLIKLYSISSSFKSTNSANIVFSEFPSSSVITVSSPDLFSSKDYWSSEYSCSSCEKNDAKKFIFGKHIKF